MRSSLQKCASWPTLLTHLSLKVKNKHLHLEGPPSCLAEDLWMLPSLQQLRLHGKCAQKIWKHSDSKTQPFGLHPPGRHARPGTLRSWHLRQVREMAPTEAVDRSRPSGRSPGWLPPVSLPSLWSFVVGMREPSAIFRNVYS